MKKLIVVLFLTLLFVGCDERGNRITTTKVINNISEYQLKQEQRGSWWYFINFNSTEYNIDSGLYNEIKTISEYDKLKNNKSYFNIVIDIETKSIIAIEYIK